MREIFKYLTIIVAMISVLSGCNRDFEWEGFGVNNDDTPEHCIKLKKNSDGTTRISVYSDSSWYAEMEDNVDWATLSNTKGKGDGYINFTYEVNHSGIRRAFVLVHSKGETRRVMVEQEGDELVFRFRAEDGSMVVEKESTTYYLTFDANIPSNYYKYIVLHDVEYEGEGGWITDAKVENEMLVLDVMTNDTEKPRKAKLTVTLTDPYTERVYTSSATITQETTSSVGISWETLLARYEAATDRESNGSWVVKTEGEEEENGVKISGVCLSSPDNPNAAMNAQSSWSGSGFAATDTSINYSTNYLVSEDGAYTMMIRMNSPQDNVVSQYSKVEIRVDKLTLCKLGEGRYQLSGVSSRNIVSITNGNESDAPTLERKISELTSSDYYRIVTLKDVELVYNKGALYNTTDGYRYACDYYPTMLRDKDGNTIYMMFSYKSTPWSRNGKEAPCGSGDVTGIITYETSLRYGDDDGSLGAFVIRPFNEECLKFNDDEEHNFSVTHTEWCWNDSNLLLEGNAAVAKVGEGKVYHELNVVPTLGPNFNGLTYSTSAEGTQVARMSCAFSSKWMDAQGAFKGLVFEFNAKTLGGGASLNLAYWAGAQSSTGLNFPSNWKLEYSIDGVAYTAVEGSEFDIHPFVWWASDCVKFAIHGLAQRSFLLPTELCGVEKAYLRLVPYNNKCASLSGPEGATFSATSANTGFYLAAVTIKYNK